MNPTVTFASKNAGIIRTESVIHDSWTVESYTIRLHEDADPIGNGVICERYDSYETTLKKAEKRMRKFESDDTTKSVRKGNLAIKNNVFTLVLDDGVTATVTVDIRYAYVSEAIAKLLNVLGFTMLIVTHID